MQITTITKIDEVYLKIDCTVDIKLLISEQYSFEVPGYKFMPMYRSGRWDGKVRLFNVANGKLPIGLHQNLIEFLYESDIIFDSNVYHTNVVSEDDIYSYIESLDLPFELFDHQRNAIITCIQNTRGLILSCTSSGKTVVIHAVAQYYKQHGQVLVIFPTASLVKQTKTAFLEYGASENDIHEIYSGQEKDTQQPIVLSTWQSIYKQPIEYFNRFSTILCDEVHTSVAKSLSDIINKLVNCKYKFGFTGTLQGSKCNELQLIGSYGEVFDIASSRKLIDSGHISDVLIKIILLKHQERKFIDYQDEIDYLVTSNSRNQFLINLIKKLKGNTLVLFNLVERHGDILYEQLKSQIDNPVYFVSGKIKLDEREDIRLKMDSEDNAVILASYGTFQAGISIKKLHNLVFASPSKSKIRNLQSIGRLLRTHSSKNKATVYDLADDIGNNYTKKHLEERISQYSKEQLDFSIYNYNLR